MTSSNRKRDSDKPKTAAKIRLAKGEHSIDRVTPRQLPDGTWVIDWRVRLHDGQLVRKRTQAPKKGILLTRAKETANNLLQAGNQHWDLNKEMVDYLDKNTAERIQESNKLKELSKRRYMAGLELLKDKFKGYGIYDAMSFETVEKTLQTIAKESPGSATTCRTILSKYVAPPLMKSGLIKSNYARDVDLNLAPRDNQDRRTLTESEWDKVLKHLLTRDTTPLLIPTKHKNIRESTRNKHARVVRLTILQAMTGMRISEANKLQWKHIEDTEDGMLINVPASITKGKKGHEKPRCIPILRADVEEYFRTHRGPDDDFVVGSPSTTSKPWDATNADDVIPHLYAQIAKETGVELLAELRSHSWRSTLHGVFADTIELSDRAAMFGHTKETAAQAYMDRNNAQTVLKTIRKAKANYA